MPIVGTSPARPDGAPKVRGEACYADDFYLPGMFYGATVRSPHPRARVEGVRHEALADDVVVLTAADLPGPNSVRLIEDDWPVLADSEVRHVGEPVVLVAARSRVEARLAAESVQVDYQPLEPLLDFEDPAAELISDFEILHGDPESELAAAARIVEGSYRCGHQEHIYIEPNAMTAWFEDDGSLVVAGSMQCPYYVHKSLAYALGLESREVRVQATAIGGGFGGKEDFPSMIAVHAAVLARAAGRPVRIVYDRHEDIIGTTKRHPARVIHRSAVRDDGTLSAVDIDVLMDGGAYTTLSPVVLSRGVLHAAGPYRCPNVRIRGRAVRTNTATNGAFRGFGAPQVQFAAERHMDRIARAVGVDPLTVRERNALRAGDTLPTGQVLDNTTSAHQCLERVAEMTSFRERWQKNEDAPRAERDPVRRGLGISLYFHGAGFTGNGERRMRSPVDARLNADGRIEILTSMTDMGQGCVAIFPQMAAEASGLGTDDFAFPDPDTAVVPDSGPTVASRTTMIIGGLIARIAIEMRDKVLAAWQGELEPPVEVGFAEGKVTVEGLPVATFREIARHCYFGHGPLDTTLRHEPSDTQQFDDETYQGEAYPTYSWGADVVEVEVDQETFETRPTRCTVVAEVGKAIHPTLCIGQVEGGTLQAIAYGLLEEVKIEEGRYLNDRLATYIIPTFKDSPRIDVELIERGWDGGPFGAKGVGELPMDGGAPAAVGAIQNAVGVTVDEIPATPERILKAARGVGSNGSGA
ncbi:MAG: xanthine dehydrogenase family protein molybdopterin-binding subunit [Thermoanaerobaculia bacterium]